MWYFDLPIAEYYNIQSVLRKSQHSTNRASTTLYSTGAMYSINISCGEEMWAVSAVGNSLAFIVQYDVVDSKVQSPHSTT